MSVQVRLFVVGPVATNCYLIYDDSKGEAILVDPGPGSEPVLRWIQEQGLELRLIVNSHGHFDHVACNLFFKRETGAKLVIHKDDLKTLRDAPYQAIWFGLEITPSPEPDITIEEGDTIEVEDVELKVIHTPGHTPGGICLLGDGILFSGDTLFRGSIGRTDLPGGSLETLIQSIKTKLFLLPDDTIVYPGHGEPTSIGEERERGIERWAF